MSQNEIASMTIEKAQSLVAQAEREMETIIYDLCTETGLKLRDIEADFPEMYVPSLFPSVSIRLEMFLDSVSK